MQGELNKVDALQGAVDRAAKTVADLTAAQDGSARKAQALQFALDDLTKANRALADANGTLQKSFKDYGPTLDAAGKAIAGIVGSYRTLEVNGVQVLKELTAAQQTAILEWQKLDAAFLKGGATQSQVQAALRKVVEALDDGGKAASTFSTTVDLSNIPLTKLTTDVDTGAVAAEKFSGSVSRAGVEGLTPFIGSVDDGTKAVQALTQTEGDGIKVTESHAAAVAKTVGVLKGQAAAHKDVSAAQRDGIASVNQLDQAHTGYAANLIKSSAQIKVSVKDENDAFDAAVRVLHDVQSSSNGSEASQRALALAMQQVGNAASAAGINIKNLGHGMNQLGYDAETAIRQLQMMKDDVDEAADSWNSLADSVGSALDRIGHGGSGGSITAGGITAPGSDPKAGDVRSMTSNPNGMYGLIINTWSEADIAVLTAQKQFGEQMKNYAQQMVDAGLSTKDAQNELKSLNKEASNTGKSLSTLVSDYLSNLNRSAKDLTTTVDGLATASTSASTSIRGLNADLQTFGNTSTSVNGSLQLTSQSADGLSKVFTTMNSTVDFAGMTAADLSNAINEMNHELLNAGVVVDGNGLSAVEYANKLQSTIDGMNASSAAANSFGIATTNSAIEISQAVGVISAAGKAITGTLAETQASLKTTQEVIGPDGKTYPNAYALYLAIQKDPNILPHTATTGAQTSITGESLPGQLNKDGSTSTYTVNGQQVSKQLYDQMTQSLYAPNTPSTAITAVTANPYDYFSNPMNQPHALASVPGSTVQDTAPLTNPGSTVNTVNLNVNVNNADATKVGNQLIQTWRSAGVPI